jgi:hypothetical protein
MSSSDYNADPVVDSAMGSKRGRRPLEAEGGGSITNVSNSYTGNRPTQGLDQ